MNLLHWFLIAMFRLLKAAAGFYLPQYLREEGATIRATPEVTNKRFQFVRAYVKLIVSSSSKHKTLLGSYGKKFEVAVQDMLTDIATAAKLEGNYKHWEERASYI